MFHWHKNFVYLACMQLKLLSFEFCGVFARYVFKRKHDKVDLKLTTISHASRFPGPKEENPSPHVTTNVLRAAVTSLTGSGSVRFRFSLFVIAVPKDATRPLSLSCCFWWAFKGALIL